MTDDDLARLLGIENDPRKAEIIAKLTPEARATYEHLGRVAIDLNLWTAGLGPKPKDVIACPSRKKT